MITCCNDGTRPVIFRLDRIDEEELMVLRLVIKPSGSHHSLHADAAGNGGCDSLTLILDGRVGYSSLFATALFRNFASEESCTLAAILYFLYYFR